jgi:hypothetical protein
MYIETHIGVSRYNLKLEVSDFWFWHPWHEWDNSDENCYALSFGLLGIELRVTKRRQRVKNRVQRKRK